MNQLPSDKKINKNSPQSKRAAQDKDKKKNLGISRPDSNKLQALIKTASKHGVSCLKVGDMVVRFQRQSPRPAAGLAHDPIDEPVSTQSIDIDRPPARLPEDDDDIRAQARATVEGFDRWRNKPTAAQSNPFE